MANDSLAQYEQSGIYEIVNTVNGKRYIGSAKNFRVRWAKHRNDLNRGTHHSDYLQRSWNKYGDAAFSFQVLELCDINDLLSREQWWLDSKSPDYNVCRTAGNCLGLRQSDETKRKRALKMIGRKFPEAAAKRTGQKRTAEQCANMSMAQKIIRALWSEERKAAWSRAISERQSGKKQSAELIAKRAAGMIGRVVSEETRAKLSAANKGRKPSEKAVAASIAARKGVKMSDEFRQKCRDRKASEETRKKMSESLKGRPRSDETKAKIAAAQKGKKLSPEAIAKRTATRMANGGYAVSEEHRKKLSEANRAYWLVKKLPTGLT